MHSDNCLESPLILATALSTGQKLKKDTEKGFHEKQLHLTHEDPMDNVNLLRKTLKPHLKWHGARLSFLALFLIALFRVKTVNLVDLSIGFKGKAKKESSAGLLPHRLRSRLERIRVRKDYKGF